MRRMPAPSQVLLDTNVWLDAFDGRRPGSAEANELIDACSRKGVTLLYAVGSVKDVYYLVGASLKRQARAEGDALAEGAAQAIEVYASACVSNMAEVATAVGADSSDVWLARKYQRLHADFEDCMVLAAATRSKADYLITNDADLLRHAPVAALSVVDFLRLMGEG